MKLQVQKEMVILDVAELRWAKAGDGADGFVDSGSCFQEERSQGSSGVATCLESLKEEAGILRQIIHVISCYNLINVDIVNPPSLPQVTRRLVHPSSVCYQKPMTSGHTMCARE